MLSLKLFAAIFCIVCCLKLTKCFEITLLGRKNGPMVNYTCLTSSKTMESAVAWEGSTVFLDKTGFIPDVSDKSFDCDISTKEECTRHWNVSGWKIENSTNFHGGEPLFDRRWEKLDLSPYQHIYVTNGTNFLVHFSLKMHSDAYVYLSTGAPNFSSVNRTVYRFIIGGYKGYRSEIRKCLNAEMCEEIVSFVEHKEILNQTQWKHFSIKRKNQEFSLFRQEEDYPLLNWTDPANVSLPTNYVYMRKGYGGFHKFHHYEFLRTTEKKMFSVGPEIKLKSGEELCIAFFARICILCELQITARVTMISNNETFLINYTTINTYFRDDWREYKFDMLNEENLLTGDKKVKLEFKTNGKYITDITNCGWNINNIRRCSKNEIRYHNVKVPQSIKVKCVSIKNNLVISTLQDNRNLGFELECEDGKISLGRTCVPCDLIYGDVAPKCQATKFCKFDPLQFSTCYCSRGYSGESCSELRLPFLIYAPMSRFINDTAIAIRLSSTEYNGPVTPVKYIIQLRAEGVDSGFKNASGPHDFNDTEEKIIGDLPSETIFQIKILLLAENVSNYNGTTSLITHVKTPCKRLQPEDVGIVTDSTFAKLTLNIDTSKCTLLDYKFQIQNNKSGYLFYTPDGAKMINLEPFTKYNVMLSNLIYPQNFTVNFETKATEIPSPEISEVEINANEDISLKWTYRNKENVKFLVSISKAESDVLFERNYTSDNYYYLKIIDKNDLKEFPRNCKLKAKITAIFREEFRSKTSEMYFFSPPNIPVFLDEVVLKKVTENTIEVKIPPAVNYTRVFVLTTHEEKGSWKEAREDETTELLSLIETKINLGYDEVLTLVLDADSLGKNGMDFVVGSRGFDGEISEPLKKRISNGPLLSDVVYKVHVVLTNEFQGKFRVSVKSFVARTKTQEPAAIKNKLQEKKEEKNYEEKENSERKSGFVWVAIVLAVLISIVILWTVKRKSSLDLSYTRFSQNNLCGSISFPSLERIRRLFSK